MRACKLDGTLGRDSSLEVFRALKSFQGRDCIIIIITDYCLFSVRL